MTRLAKLAFCAAIALPSAALAGMITDEGLEPYEICAMCHSLDGTSRMSKFPKLAGLPPAYIEKQIGDFLAGRRSNDGGQMIAIVEAELAGEDIRSVANWFASQPAPAPLGDGDVKGAARFADLGSAICHDESQPASETPHLTAQHQAYLVKQMIDYRDGRRGTTFGDEMMAAMKGISDVDIDAIASYLAATPRGFKGGIGADS